MKKYFITSVLFLFLVTIQTIYAQDNSKSNSRAETKVDCSFGLYQRVKFKLISDADSVNYKLNPISCTEFKDTLILGKTEQIFSKDLKEDEIEVVFSIGYYFEPNSKEGNNEPQSILIIKNNTPHSLKYNAKICVCGKDSFIDTSVAPIFAEISVIEIWPYCIEKIALYDFKKKE